MHDMFIETEEQRAILESVKKFVDDVVKPKSAELDAMDAPDKRYCGEIVKAANDLGLRTMTLSEKYGGLSAD